MSVEPPELPRSPTPGSKLRARLLLIALLLLALAYTAALLIRP